MSLLLVAVLVLPLIGAALAASGHPRAVAGVPRVGVLAAMASAAGAVTLLVRVAVAGPVSAVWAGSGEGPRFGVGVDHLTAVLLLLVCGVSALVQAFGARYLAGDARLRWWVAGAGLLTSASAGMMTMVTLVGLAVCWSVAGVALWLLLGTYPLLPAAAQGRRRVAVAFGVGDACLWAAVGLATARWGNLDLRHLHAGGLPGGRTVVTVVVSCLLVFAALSRSAQVPFQGWLPATLAAPTPVSALLHAGVVNAGGVLLVRLAPLAGGSRWALGLAFGAGAVTAVYGTALMVTRPDVKGALAHSTMGQMGFMIMTCGLGLYAAAVIHLVLHGVYKAALFLASGTAIRRTISHQQAPPPPVLSPRTRHGVTVTALLVPGMVLAAAVRLVHPTLGGHTGAGTLLVFAWATASAAAAGWLRRHPTPLGALTAALALAGALIGYVAVIHAADQFLAPALPHPAAGLPDPAWLLALTPVAFGGLAMLRQPTLRARSRGTRNAHDRLYVAALSAGHVPAPRPRVATTPAGRARLGLSSRAQLSPASAVGARR